MYISFLCITFATMKKILLLIAGMFVLCTCKRTSFDKQVADEAKHFNTTDAPKRIDQCTMLDSMSYDIENHILTYHYTIEGVADDKSLLTKEVNEEFHEQLLNELRSSIRLKPYKEKGITFSYLYVSKKSGKILMNQTISQKDYQ